MPINPNSRLRKTRKAIHGWKDGGKFYTSIRPRSEQAAANEHSTAREALQEASKRHLTLIWEDDKAVG